MVEESSVVISDSGAPIGKSRVSFASFTLSREVRGGEAGGLNVALLSEHMLRQIFLPKPVWKK